MSAASETPVTANEVAALFADLSESPVLILGVSGGPDSTALLWLAARWRDGLNKPPKLIALTVDHGLRKESAGEARAVAKLAKRLKVAHCTLRWNGRKPKTGIQEAAREARYRLLGAAATKVGASHVVTAHTQDDQAETVLFRLARGSGIAGLKGMARSAPLPAQDTPVRLSRPLLDVPKSRLLATLAAAKIPFADDPSNRDPRFTRPRLREVMPTLATEGLDARRLASLAKRIARADAAIERAVDDAAQRVTTKSGRGIAFGSGYADLPAEISLRLLGRAIAETGNEGPVELGKLETLYEVLAVEMAQGRGAPFRRTLAGAMVTLSGTQLTVEPAPPRRTAAKAGKSARKGPFTKPR